MCPIHHNRPNIIINIQPKTVRGICYNYVSIGSDYLVILFLELNLYFVAQYTFSTNPFNDGQTFWCKKTSENPAIAISKEFWYFSSSTTQHKTTSQQIVISCASDQFHICLCSLENVVHFYSFIVNDRSQFSVECRAISYLATRIIIGS